MLVFCYPSCLPLGEGAERSEAEGGIPHKYTKNLHFYDRHILKNLL